MLFELRELSQSTARKALKIIGVNILLWTAIFVGYHYIPDILNVENGKPIRLVVVILMGPAVALMISIQIGVKAQRIFTANEQGIRFGDPVMGIKHYSWNDISHFDLSPDSKLLTLSLKNTDNTQSIPLKSFGINQQQYDNLLQWSSAALGK
ncbi:MAG: hypothetical protein KJ556_07380 [Gammaproteobacteria bacterium]|nr:hypothetical protein [Gammaproteobacteria bacterium]MBU2057329.1 hypothetical protein [Gammaproteobacteria bacterium]MBU2174931.1 hypothetical protein [Gammaproteobacteria bacterium]MBU2245536.1 hypothetical protein [Gammaproteobacteria bacterium]MBU2344430.1 hypothetical protein [Gammaproteobacteria bacterium]